MSQLKPILEPDTQNTNKKYWEKVLQSYNLSMNEGEASRICLNRRTLNEKKLRRVTYVGTLTDLVGIEEEEY